MYKLYKTGQQFLDENISLIQSDPLGTTFFEANAKMISQCDESNYAIRVDVDGNLLLAIHVGEYPLVVYGSEQCVYELARIVAQHKLQFKRAIGFYDVTNAFLIAYEQIVGGTHKVNLSMDVMYCKKVNPCDTFGVELANIKDVEEIAQLVVDFTFDALSEKPDWDKTVDKVSQRINSYALLRVEGKIVAIASCLDDNNGPPRLSYVYTKPEHRNKGYSRKVVTYLTDIVINSGKVPCLHVDQNNPISNHLYLSIGYVYGKSRYEMVYIPDNK